MKEDVKRGVLVLREGRSQQVLVVNSLLGCSLWGGLRAWGQGLCSSDGSELSCSLWGGPETLGPGAGTLLQ